MPDVHSQIDIRSLSLNIAGTQVLEDISLAVAQGEFVGVIGPNGAGKSSLLKAVYGFKYSRGAQIAGEVSVDGDSVGHYSRRALAQKIAVVLQEPIMPFELSVYDVIAMGLTPNKPLLSFITKDDRVEIMQAAEQVDLVHKLPQSLNLCRVARNNERSSHERLSNSPIFYFSMSLQIISIYATKLKFLI